jgi:hypothetical protein
MHYRLEDVCNAIAIIKEDNENSNSSIHHEVQTMESRLEEVAISTNTNVASLQSRSSRIEELVRSFELQFYKSLGEYKEELMNKLRDNMLGNSDDRAALDRRVAIVENIVSSLSEKNRVSNDTIELYFAGSKDIKKFDMVS